MDNPTIDSCGTKIWYNSAGEFHRDNGPAIEYANGDKTWYQNGKLHRLDGPAIEFVNGYKSWSYRGKEVKCSSQENFEKLLKLKLFW